MNKKTLEFICIMVLTIFVGSSFAQKNMYLPHQTNTKPTCLSYTFAVMVGETVDCVIGEQIAKKTNNLATVKFNPVHKLDSLPDVLFVVGANSEKLAQIKQSVANSGSIVVRLGTKNVVKAAVEYLKQRYLSAPAPTYSTVFSMGDRYHNYRIPSITQTSNGTIVAFAEARASFKDQAENDIVSKYSIDGGNTWSDLIVIDDNGASSLNNPTPTYVAQTNTIVLLYQDYPPKTSETSNATIKCFMTKSSDDGKTWSTPIDITESIKPSDATSFCTGPASGIVIKEGQHKGRLVVSCNVNWPMWYNYLIYSDDQGETWSIADGKSSYGTNESQVVEIGENELLVCARVHKNIADTAFLAPKDWSPWRFDTITRSRALINVNFKDDKSIWNATEVRDDIEDPNCQGSIVSAVGREGVDVLVMSNPASRLTRHQDDRPYQKTAPMRVNGSLRYSCDNGKTWNAPKRIYGDRFTEFQYSVLLSMEKGVVGCIFEANEDVKFAKINLDWLME